MENIKNLEVSIIFQKNTILVDNLVTNSLYTNVILVV